MSGQAETKRQVDQVDRRQFICCTIDLLHKGRVDEVSRNEGRSSGLCLRLLCMLVRLMCLYHTIINSISSTACNHLLGLIMLIT